MKLKVRSEALRDGVNKVLSVVDKRNSRPILTNCLLQTSEDGECIEVMATDTEVSAKVKVNALVTQSGNFCVNSKNIAEILRQMPNDEISMTIGEDKNILIIECQKIRFDLLIFESDEYPFLNFKNEKTLYDIEAGLLHELLTKTSHAMSTDETRSYLGGVFLHKWEGKLRTVSTDGHRLTLYDGVDHLPDNDILSEGIIIPKKGILEIKKLAEHFPNTKLQMSLDDSFVYVSALQKYFLSTRLISREFPKYQAAIPNKTVYFASIDYESLLTCLKRVKIMANEQSNGINLTLKKNSMTLSANHDGLGDALETITVEYDGPEITIGLNVKYLYETLMAISDDTLIIEFNNEIGPLLLKFPKTPQFLSVVMPLKL